MSNSVANPGLQPIFLAAETLKTLTPLLQPLKKIAVTDFSGYVAEKGSVVHTRFAGKSVASTYDASAGFVAEPAVSNDVAVTLSDYDYVLKEFPDIETSTISVEMLQRVFAAPIANAVQVALFSRILNATTEANFSKAAYDGTLANFNRIAVAKAATEATKVNLPLNDRAMLLSPDAFGALLADPTVAQYLSIGDTSVIRDGKVGRLHGIDMYEYNGFPTSGDAFDEGLAGLLSCQQGHVIVTRPPVAPTTGGGEQFNATDPDSEFTFAMRTWYNWQKGTTNIWAGWLTGNAVGNPDALLRVAISG